MPRLPFDDHGSEVFWSEVPGELPARVFVHGLGGTGAAIFADIAGHPALAGHRSIVVDLPGHGLSDRPSDFGYSLDEHAAVVARICRRLALDGIDLVGHSLGGDIAVTVAGRNAGLVGRLVISEANLDPLPPAADGERFSQRIAARTEAEFVETLYPSILDSVPAWRPMLRLCDPVAVYRSAVGLVTHTRPTGREMIESMTMPRTFIRGDRGEELRDSAGLTASGVRLVVVENAGHMIMDDQPAAFVRALVGALRPAP